MTPSPQARRHSLHTVENGGTFEPRGRIAIGNLMSSSRPPTRNLGITHNPPGAQKAHKEKTPSVPLSVEYDHLPHVHDVLRDNRRRRPSTGQTYQSDPTPNCVRRAPSPSSTAPRSPRTSSRRRPCRTFPPWRSSSGTA